MMTRGGTVCLQLFVASFLLCGTVFCGPDRVCTPEVKLRGPDPRGTCGDSLTEALWLICMISGGGFNSKWGMAVKKSNTHDISPQTVREVRLKKRAAISFLHKKNQYEETGVVCECCYHLCSPTEMVHYCSEASGSNDFMIKRDFETRQEKQSRPTGSRSTLHSYNTHSDFEILNGHAPG